MFSRVVEIRCKASKKDEVVTLIKEKLLPILKPLRGFQDELVLTSETDPRRVLALSFWAGEEDAEQYQRERFPEIADALRPLCEGEPVVSTFDVGLCTFVHTIDLRKKTA
jgi:heme-degrading monooxygenase HmoA